MLRRGGDTDDPGLYDGVLEAGPVRMDVERHVVSVNGEPITLPLKEFDLLEYLMRNSGRVLTAVGSADRSGVPTTSGTPRRSTSTSSGCVSKIEADPANRCTW